MYWLCQGSIVSFDELDDSAENEAIHKASADYQQFLAGLWLFGDAYMLPKLQNDAMKMFLEHTQGRMVGPAAVKYVFANTAPDCVLRVAFLEEAIYDSLVLRNYKEEEKNEVGAIPGFLFAVSKRTTVIKRDCNHHRGCECRLQDL
jgi:hypothetical protein